MADEIDAEAVAALRKKRQFKKFTYRGHEVERLLDMSKEELSLELHARARRRMMRGITKKPQALMKKLMKVKKACGPLERPKVVKTHLRNMIVMPEMVGSTVAIYNGKEFNMCDIKAEMVGFYLGEFSITYRPVRHGRPGIGGNNANRFMPLK